jgi:2-aminoethylphosphonate-pyruvate transaminase
MSDVFEHRQILLTPGPLTTSPTVKQAMQVDWGSRDRAFIAMTARIRKRLVALAGGDRPGGSDFVCVPVQGSGTFAVEATLGTLLSRQTDKILILINGAYGRRMARICELSGQPFDVYETKEDTPPDPAYLAELLDKDASLTHVAVVHCETTSGILNPIDQVAKIVTGANRRLIIDAMSTFGALPIDLPSLKADVVIASANKGLEGIPGVGFALIEKNALNRSEGNSTSLSLDLHDQFTYLEKTGQWRFTPPTHVLAALDKALDELDAEGGVAARGTRYTNNCRLLVDGLMGLGFETFIPMDLQAPVIVTVRMPGDRRFDFQQLYAALADQGIVLYPGAVTQEKSFRVGCIGQIFEPDIARTLAALEKFLTGRGIPRDGLRPAD